MSTNETNVKKKNFLISNLKKILQVVSNAKYSKKEVGARPIILTTGGTGGHIIPAMKIASDLVKKGRKVFFITDRRFAQYEKLFAKRSFFSSPNLKIIITPVSSFSGSNSVFYFLKNCIVTFFKTCFVFLKARPKIVIGFGSYASFFPLLVALLTFRVIIIHEQNVVFGKVNKFFSKFAKSILLSFPDLSYFSRKEYKMLKNKSIISGLPSFLPEKRLDRAFSSKVIYDLSTKSEIVILITGGGQAASFFSTQVPPAISMLAKSYPEKKFIIYHQVKQGEIEATLKLYASVEAKNIILTIKPLFENIPEILNKADFAIIRGGAGSIIETAISKVFPIIVPLPNSSLGHQVKNASFLSNNNAAMMLPQADCTPEKLFMILSRALNDGLFYFPVVNAASNLFRTDASQIFGNVILYNDLQSLKLYV